MPTPARPATEAASKTIMARVLEVVQASPADRLFVMDDFEAAAERTSLENALRRLTASGEILRVDRGCWCRPLPAMAETRRPILDGLMRQLGDLTRDALVPDGPASAHHLGLLDRPPVRAMYLTRKDARRLDLGRLQVGLVPADAWLFEGGHTEAGRVVRALGWAGFDRVADVWRILKGRLPAETVAEVETLAPRLPLWMSRALTPRDVAPALWAAPVPSRAV